MSILDSALRQISLQKILSGQRLRPEAAGIGAASRKPRSAENKKIKPTRSLERC